MAAVARAAMGDALPADKIPAEGNPTEMIPTGEVLTGESRRTAAAGKKGLPVKIMTAVVPKMKEKAVILPLPA